MARPLRIEFSGGVYHITTRGNRRQSIYPADEDRVRFLRIISHVVKRFGWICHAYCLMGNHYHLLIETPNPNLSRGMRQLNGVYTQRFNATHSKTGHLFQGRYKAIVVQKDSHLLEVMRYVVLNPVRSGMVTSPHLWEWSSYRATIGSVATPHWLTTDWVLRQFGSQRSKAVSAYKAFVRAGTAIHDSPWDDLSADLVFGDTDFIHKLRAAIDPNDDRLKEIPRRQRQIGRPTLTQMFAHIYNNKAMRNQAIANAYLQYQYPMTEISRHLGLHYATVHRAVHAAEAKC